MKRLIQNERNYNILQQFLINEDIAFKCGSSKEHGHLILETNSTYMYFKCPHCQYKKEIPENILTSIDFDYPKGPKISNILLKLKSDKWHMNVLKSKNIKVFLEYFSDFSLKNILQFIFYFVNFTNSKINDLELRIKTLESIISYNDNITNVVTIKPEKKETNFQNSTDSVQADMDINFDNSD